VELIQDGIHEAMRQAAPAASVKGGLAPGEGRRRAGRSAEGAEAEERERRRRAAARRPRRHGRRPHRPATNGRRGEV
jgi:hypothetical protein